MLSRKDGLVLRGRLAFADAHVFGRAGRRCLQGISKHAYAKPFKAEISQALRRSLQVLPHRLATAPAFDCWFLYTDASFEPDGTGGIGGVIIDPGGRVNAWFGFQFLQKSPCLIWPRVNALL